MIQEKKSKKFVTLGSVNIDHILNLEQFPRPGETVTGSDYNIAFGGKGANQAVAAGRSNASITFLACVGDDAMGNQFREQLVKDNVNIAALEIVPGFMTGVALIFVNEQGENVIAISAGANAALTPEYVERHKNHIIEADALLMQLESPLPSVLKAAQIARSHGTKVILNPAPGQMLSDELLNLVDIITPNETEAEKLTSIAVTCDEEAALAAEKLHEKGIETVIITLGGRGAWVSEKGQDKNVKGRRIEGFKVSTVDTIAAGDTFNGALLTALLEGRSMEDAVRFGHAAAAIAVTRSGAQPSIPWRKEIDTFLAEKTR